MFIIFDAVRPSDSPFVERVWRCHSERAGNFLTVASSHWEMVVTLLNGTTTVTLHGPETRVREVFCPANGEWFAIRFKAGAFMPALPAGRMLNGNDVVLPQISRRSFHLQGSKWELPSFDNAETFVAHLVKAGILKRDPAVEAALQGDTQALSRRSAQRHFLHATGITHTAMRQIERARYATNLLRSGVSIHDTVQEARYFDQAHLTRSLKHFVGLTPAKIALGRDQLSFLYNTTPLRET